MINMLRKGIKFSIQRVYFPQCYFESRHYGKRFNSIGKFKSLTFQLRAIYFDTFAVDMSVYLYVIIYKLYCLISFSFVGVQRNCGPLWHLSMCCIPQKFTRYKSSFSFCSFSMTL